MTKPKPAVRLPRCRYRRGKGLCIKCKYASTTGGYHKCWVMVKKGQCPLGLGKGIRE